MKHFNPGIINRLFRIDLLLTREGIYVILEFKKRPIKFFKRQHTFIGKVNFSKGYTFEERFDIIQRWADSLDYKVAVDKFYNSGHKVRPILYFNRELRIDFNVALEQILSEDLIENSWKSFVASND